MPEGAVMEAPVAAPAASSESVSSPISDSQVSSQSTSIEDTGVPAETGETTEETQPKTGTRPDLSSVVRDKAKMEALKALDPSLPGLVRDAVFGAQQIKKEFPAGGLKEAIQYRDTVKQMGGVQGIQETKQGLEDYDNLDALYTEGKKEFIEQIAQGDPEAFEKMVPLAVEHFARQNPEHYQHLMSRVLVNTLDKAQFPQMLQEAYKGATSEGQAVLQRMWDAVQGYRDLSAKIPEKKIDPERQKLEQEKQTWAQQKTQQLEASVNRKSVQYRDSLIAKELKPFAKWEELDQDRKDAVIREFRARTAKIVNSDEGFKTHRNRLLQNGDEEGAARLEREFLDQHTPQIVPRVAKLFWSNPGKVAPKVPVPGNKPAVPTAKGIVMVNKMPDAASIKRGFGGTTRDMLMANQAILNDGRKVQWP